jgi:hypothetical protein
MNMMQTLRIVLVASLIWACGQSPIERASEPEGADLAENVESSASHEAAWPPLGTPRLDEDCRGLPGAEPADCILPGPLGMPFVLAAAPVTDGTSAARARNPVPGTVCLSGTAAQSGPASQNWGAVLSLPLSQPNADGTGFESVFDAEQLGITGLRFRIQNPPSTGVTSQLLAIPRFPCETGEGCITSATSFVLQGPAGPVLATEAVTARLDAYTDATDPSVPNRLFALQFGVAAESSAALGFDFCVTDLAFLDAGGAEVRP